MAQVRVNSGQPDPAQLLRDVPKNLWPELVLLRRDFLNRRLGHDCRCLVQFVREAEQMWESLGYAGPDDLITRGYELQPEEVRLAVRWLELNEPAEAVGLPDALTKAQRLAADPEFKALGRHGGHTVSQKEGADSTFLRGSANSAYLVRRLKRDAPEVAAALGRGEYRSARAAAIAAGIVREPTALDLLRRLWKKASAAEKRTFLKEVS